MMIVTDLDRRIWEEELADFLPRRMFDVHTHVYRWDFNTDPQREQGPYYEMAGRQFPRSDWELLQCCDEELMPGREVSRLSFGFPFSPECDFAASNRFTAEQSRRDAASGGLMLVHPSMADVTIDATLEEHGLLGLKPYRFYSVTGDAAECRITDFLPEHQVAVADRRGAMVMLHLSKREGIASRENLDDLARLTERYPRVRWILAHCARAYSDWPLRAAALRLRDLPVWYDTSSVCESDAHEALLETVGPGRVMYGSDDLPVGALRGKYIAFGRGWAYLSPTNHSFSLAHCEGRMTFTRYEQLRAMRRAMRRLRLGQAEVEAVFFGNAAELVAEAKKRTANF